MFKNYGQLVTGIVIGLVLGLLAGKGFFGNKPQDRQPAAVQNTLPAEHLPPARQAPNSKVAIPQKVYDVLKYIRENGHAMPGWVGGRIFSNREELLPREDNAGKPILYHEWDVNPKKEGQNRGTERIITGSDERAWYTNDHYQSFTEIK